MKHIAREFRDEVLAVLLCLWMEKTTPPWRGVWLMAPQWACKAAWRAAVDIQQRRIPRLPRAIDIARAIATVERWPVTP